MSTLNLQPLGIPDVFTITPKQFEDSRGYFTETFNKRSFESQTGLNIEFVQDNFSHSVQQGTLRGLHFQRPPFDQAKLVSVVQGAIFDVAVDIRKGSPTFAKWVGAELSALNRRQIFIPRGFLHGFLTLQPDTQVSYKVDNFYSAEHDAGVSWDDVDINIQWPSLNSPPILSSKDIELPNLASILTPFTYKETFGGS